MKQTLLFFSLILSVYSAFADKPRVWIVSDGSDPQLRRPNGKNFTDPDDVSAIAGYLIMSNHFDTRAIVVASNSTPLHLQTPDQKIWADSFFGKAYAEDLPQLNKKIGGYQDEILFLESCIKRNPVKYTSSTAYVDLEKFDTIQLLIDEVKSSDEPLYVLCWGALTEPAIFVNHCVATDQLELLEKVKFVSHWTNSYFHVGTMEQPEHVHNCFNDAEACDYMKEMALNGVIQYYECGAIGQYGIVEGSPIGAEYYEPFKVSSLGKIWAEGKYNKHKKFVDDSDSATFWAMIGTWGVGLSDIRSNGTNTPEIEKRNEELFAAQASNIRGEMLRRIEAAKPLVNIPNVFPEMGLTDPHSIIVDGRLYLFCGHDESWDTDNTWKMNRWEIHSTDDLTHWCKEGEILPTQTYIGDEPNCWAGDITEKDGKYYWYFSHRSHDTGVMVADHPTGPWKDALGKPLLPHGIINGHPYDPEIYEEDGVYSIIFASGVYRIATLGDDMISLASEPEEIKVLDKDGNPKWTKDKSALFKHNGYYYLLWGADYAMSENLRGPYHHKGKFLEGGHNNVFEWEGQLYAVMENKDIGLFYRGVSLKPVEFNKDGTIKVPADDAGFPGDARKWAFNNSRMGWRATSGCTLEWDESGLIKGDIQGHAAIESAPWLLGDLTKVHAITIRIKNKSNATQARISIAQFQAKGKFWDKAEIDWEQQIQIPVMLIPNSDEFVEYTFDLSNYPGIKDQLKRVRVEPALDATSGQWEIEFIGFK